VTLVAVPVVSCFCAALLLLLLSVLAGVLGRETVSEVVFFSGRRRGQEKASGKPCSGSVVQGEGQ
jgi:hypothetical protein